LAGLFSLVIAGAAGLAFRERRSLELELVERQRVVQALEASEARLQADVASRKRAEEEKSRLEEHLLQAQKMEAIGTLAGGIAHDFNNILVAIVGYTDLARERAVDQEQRDDLAQVRVAANRATELTRQVLAFSRRSKAEAVPVKPRGVLKEALKLLRASLPATIEIRQDLASESVVLADPGELHRILVNLCTNAAHAMEEKGGVLEVRLDDVDLDAAFAAGHPGLEPGRFVQLTVKDSGCGMTEEVRARIFEPFFTTRGQDRGTGLGLSVVHGLVTLRRGAITVASALGKGSTFRVLLPIDPKAREEGAAQPDVAALGTERILFVDDEAAVTHLAARALGRLGYRVTTCPGGPEAVERFRAAPGEFDLLITDMTMPHMTGDLLVQVLRALRPALPVILCTGFSDKITPEKAREQGIDEFVYKPVDTAALSRLIRRVLSERAGRAEV
jgi:signal transduction histidine kinase/ActR/RegA family two-component response regulator